MWWLDPSFWKCLNQRPPKPEPLPDAPPIKELHEAWDEHLNSVRSVRAAAEKNEVDAKKLGETLSDLIAYMEQQHPDARDP